jgi:hypothetical protein
MKRLSKIKTIWSTDLAYAVGIITTDGNLSPNNRSINVTSKDLEMINNIKECLGISNKIGRKGNGSSEIKRYYVIQFGDVNFYEFLNSIGLTKNKSKTIGELKIPDEFFIDFLRGCLDGDGNIDVYKHKESNIPQLKLRFCSASIIFLKWIKQKVKILFKIEGGSIHSNKLYTMHILSYGKTDAGKILKFMYYRNVQRFLNRKYKIALPFIKE